MSYQAFVLAGNVVDVRPGWNLKCTANGRDTLEATIVSLDGTLIPDIDDDLYVNEAVAVVSSTAANPTTITTAEPHGLVSGYNVEIAGHSLGGVNGDWIATVTGPTTFTIPVLGGGVNGVASRKIFGGSVDEPETAGFGGSGSSPAVTTVITGADNNAQADHRYLKAVLPAGTLKSQLQLIGTTMGFTIHPAQVTGPAMPELPADYALLRDVLNQMTVSSAGYPWEFDAFGYLRMFAPMSEPAPVDVIDGNGVAIGDIKVKPTRSGYANRVILRFSDSARASYGFLTTSGNFSNGETVTLGSKTYTFQSVLTNTDGNVAVGATEADSLNNLIAAITLGVGSGTAYAAAMTVNSQASAYLYRTSMMIATALTAGASGNSIAVSDTATNASWTGEGGIPLSTLALGADQALTNVTVAQDDAAIAAHQTWEVVIQSPDITSAADAATLAAAYLSIKLLMPKQVTYTTEKLGLRPGQTQTINVAYRNINNTFLITDVVHQNTQGSRVVRTVTAIESLLLPSSPRWRDLYKQWSSSGGGSSSAATVSGGGGGGGGSTGRSVYFLGAGSLADGVSSPTPDWVPPTAVQVRIDTTVRGTTAGTVYVRMKAIAGTVTARLRNVSSSVTVGTSTAQAAGSWVTVSFPVTLTAGSYLYELQLLPSIANSKVQLGSAYME